MESVYPFGSTLKKVEQQDKSPKKVFVLGVYASAVHAKWKDVDGKTKVNALAVASEPYIFWKGEDAKQIIDKINIPSELGKLVPADKRFNGPSGKVLDDLFLRPLEFRREDAWLCDLLPYSRLNENQQKAIETHYNPLIMEFNLPECTIPAFNGAELNNAARVKEIVVELEQSQADTIILLGDAPIKYFLSYFVNCKKLSDFGDSPDDYGKTHKSKIAGKTYKIIPLVHPRQAGKLGKSNQYWGDLHQIWAINKAITQLGKLIEKKDPTQIINKPKICPFCKSKKIAKYIYGLPDYSEKLQMKIDKGKIILGECCLSGDDPDYACIDCKTNFFKIL